MPARTLENQDHGRGYESLEVIDDLSGDNTAPTSCPASVPAVGIILALLMYTRKHNIYVLGTRRDTMLGNVLVEFIVLPLLIMEMVLGGEMKIDSTCRSTKWKLESEMRGMK